MVALRGLGIPGPVLSGLSLLVAISCKGTGGPSPEESTPTATVSTPTQHPILDQSIAQLHGKLVSGDLKVEELVRFYLERIERYNVKNDDGLRAVISVNKKALDTARGMDALPAAEKATTDLLWGIPILVKDNIETLEDLPTTAGSTALVSFFPRRDARLMEHLRKRGAIVLGKANLTSWAGIRGTPGWSAVGGQTANPYGESLSPSGSSSGSAVAVAAGLAVAAIGTETMGSIVSPSSANGVVGIRPANGIVAQGGIVPIMLPLDTAGPIARRVEDAAILLSGMAEPSGVARDFPALVRNGSLKGKKIGYVEVPGDSPMAAIWNEARQDLVAGGAEVVVFQDKEIEASGCNVDAVLTAGLKIDLERYLKALPREIPVHSVGELVRYNEKTPAEKASNFFPDLLEESLKMTAPERKLRESLPPCQKAARDWFALAKKQGLDAIVDFADSSGTSFGSFAGLSYMSIPMGGTDETGPIGMGIYVDQGREDVMLAAAAGFEAQSKGRHLRWPQGFGPTQP